MANDTRERYTPMWVCPNYTSPRNFPHAARTTSLPRTRRYFRSGRSPLDLAPQAVASVLELKNAPQVLHLTQREPFDTKRRKRLGPLRGPP